MKRLARWLGIMSIVSLSVGSLTCGRPSTATSPSPGPTPNLAVSVAVKNSKFGTATPSDFMIAVAGGPAPTSFSAPDEGTVLVSLPAGVAYTTNVSGPSGYAVAPGVECSGTIDASRRSCQITLTEQPMVCDDALWTPVYLRDRLRVLDACQAISGIVADVGLETDGDLVMELIPDPQYISILRPGNRSNPDAHGHLIVEVPCQGPTTEAAPRVACASFTGTRIPVPTMGSHIVAAAHWVEDLNHAAWGELHGARVLALPR
jgi:hypothetical protein